MHYGIDFGANAGGLREAWRSRTSVRRLEETFARLAASGVRYVRWFLFCDGRAGIRFSAGGRPQGLDEFVFRDVDAALEIASRNGIRIMFVLLDFLWCDPATVTRGVQMGGRSGVLADAGGRDALLDLGASAPQRYGEEPQILAWDIINEPEWIKSDRIPRTSVRSSSIASLWRTRLPVTR